MYVHQALPSGDKTTNSNAVLQNFAKVAYKTSNYILGGIFRNIFFGKLSHTDTTQRACKDFLSDEQALEKPRRQDVLQEFKIRTEDYEFTLGPVSYQFQIKVYESINGDRKHTCLRVGGRDETAQSADIRAYPLLKAYTQANKLKNYKEGLCILQLSLHDHKVKKTNENKWRPWESGSAEETSRAFFAFLKHLQQNCYIQIDSLICHSLGSVVLEAVDSEDVPLPPLLILDRALPSVWKVGCKLYNPIVAYLLYGGAYIAGWGADPEQRLTQFFNKDQKQTGHLDRKVVLIEVKSDWYFSGPGAFADDFTDKLNKSGIEAHRKCFSLNDIAYHPRAHHALSLGKIKNGGTQDQSDTLPLQPYESAASGIIKYLMFKDQ